MQQLRRWAAEEFGLPADSLPSDGCFKTWVSARPPSVALGTEEEDEEVLAVCVYCVEVTLVHRFFPPQALCRDREVHMETCHPTRFPSEVSLHLASTSCDLSIFVYCGFRVCHR